MIPEEGRLRVVIEAVTPDVECGRFPAKKIIGEKVTVEADIFADGHDTLAADLLYRKEGESVWAEVPMDFLVNDRWRGTFTVGSLGKYYYTLRASIDHFETWRQDMGKRIEARQETPVDFLIGANLVDDAREKADPPHREMLREWAGVLRSEQVSSNLKGQLALSDEVGKVMRRYVDRRFAVTYGKEMPVVVDRERAGFSTWYEAFPRSCAAEPGKHGTFRDCIARLDYIAGMGFDVLYFPPIHPIGRSYRKGRNNSVISRPEDPGSPWAIGAEEGGHKAIHPQLGTFDDLHELINELHQRGMELALDIALNSSPEHHYVREHPEWFLWRPDGTIQYAENPPKKYQDVYPLNFDSESWRELWEEVKSIFLFWIGHGIRIFRVDNPHTKPFIFWEWLINDIKKDYPDVIILSEAFTRPKVMYRLAKLGFTQSYTYYTWRNVKWELTQYFTELTQPPVSDFFRPNLWPNTPDILPFYLQAGGRPAFIVRLIMAATFSSNYGIYGPAFELGVNTPREPGVEEYLGSEKYELKSWPIYREDSLSGLIGRVNRIRKENPALQSNRNLRFYRIDNDQIICYSKQTDDLSNIIVVVVNLDSRYTQSGWVELRLDLLGLDAPRPYEMHDLLTGARYQWQGAWNYVELSPQRIPTHIFRVTQKSRTM